MSKYQWKPLLIEICEDLSITLQSRRENKRYGTKGRNCIKLNRLIVTIFSASSPDSNQVWVTKQAISTKREHGRAKGESRLVLHALIPHSFLSRWDAFIKEKILLLPFFFSIQLGFCANGIFTCDLLLRERRDTNRRKFIDKTLMQPIEMLIPPRHLYIGERRSHCEIR